ncbi:uncharacterized protein EI90DRAFT_3253798 [Cantharellus anzutake]|uniref:uncharacterized protein n=1 Tax=Cantharellus anzutake TaxID=1750568 RepID=UPI001907DF83|nr:uncharacterized protein EI90DRAFT_3253798 [Cantharellus anzutake]KAF8320193.1 hypothetical protein EI90DRAFT_3253798 [Cantharellus anzutake]
MSGHQNPGNAAAGTAIENFTDPIDSEAEPWRSTAEGYFHDTIPSFASTSTLPGFLPAATEPSAFPEPSVDDFLFEHPIFLNAHFIRYLIHNCPICCIFYIFYIVLEEESLDEREFYLRLDRRRDRQVPLLFGVRDLGTSRAIDTAAVSGRLDHLLDYTNMKSGVEAIMVFPTPAPLIAAAQILYAIAAESPGYKLTKSWCGVSGGCMREGHLTIPQIGAGKRDGIKDLAYSHLEKQISDKSEAILRYANLIGESKLTQAIKSVLDAVKYHHVRE